MNSFSLIIIFLLKFSPISLENLRLTHDFPVFSKAFSFIFPASKFEQFMQCDLTSEKRHFSMEIVENAWHSTTEKKFVIRQDFKPKEA